MLILSPPCRMYSKLMQNLNFGKMDPTKKARQWADAHTMLDFAMHLARLQHTARRLFVFEHPSSASSWQRKSVVNMKNLPGVWTCVFDQCRFGLQAPRNGKPLRKKTRFLTNSIAVWKAFNQKFCNCQVPHQPILGSDHGVQISMWAAKYPPMLCSMLVQCVIEEPRGSYQSWTPWGTRLVPNSPGRGPAFRD